MKSPAWRSLGSRHSHLAGQPDPLQRVRRQPLAVGAADAGVQQPVSDVAQDALVLDTSCSSSTGAGGGLARSAMACAAVMTRPPRLAADLVVDRARHYQHRSDGSGEMVERLFLPFTRLDDRTRHDGLGLGLTLDHFRMQRRDRAGR
jgi:hypothetical protein